MPERRKKQSPYHPDRDRARNVQLQERDFAILKQVMEDRFFNSLPPDRLIFSLRTYGEKAVTEIVECGIIKTGVYPRGF